MKPRVTRVLIPDGDYPHTLQVARCLGVQGGYEIIVASLEAKPRLRHSRYVAGVRTLSLAFKKGNCDEILRICREEAIDILLPVSEPGIRCASAHRDRFADVCSVAPVPEVGAFDCAVDKSALARLLVARDLPGLPGWNASELISNPDLWPSIPFPVLLKARRGSFGRQITYAANAGDLAGALEDVSGKSSQYFVQAYIDGQDVDCSVLCRRGEILAHTIQQERKAAHFGTFQPPVIVEFVHDDEVLDTVRSMMKSLNWTGVAHVDLRRKADTGDLYVLEVNGRFWGSILGSLLVGVNVPHLACLTAEDIPFKVPEFRPGLYFTRGIAGRAGNHQGIRYDWRRSNLPFVLRDPVPEFLGRIGRSTDRSRD